MDLFAYGTLQFEAVWRRVVGRRFPSLAGEAAEFAAYRVEGYDFPGMTPEAGATTAGTVYLGLDEMALARLDAFEGEFYERWTLPIVCEGGEVRRCEAYVVSAGASLLTGERWTREGFEAGGGLDRFLKRYEGFERSE